MSRITDKILPIVREWQQRPLEGIYAVVFLDAIHYHVRSEGQIVKKAVYIAIGIDLDGRKDVLGMWVGENESAKFWATALNGLKNRGVEDIFIACTDNLAGFDAAIHATFPQTEIQNCILHQLRNSSRYVSYKDLKALMADLQAVYPACASSPTGCHTCFAARCSSLSCLVGVPSCGLATGSWRTGRPARHRQIVSVCLILRRRPPAGLSLSRNYGLRCRIARARKGRETCPEQF